MFLQMHILWLLRLNKRREYKDREAPDTCFFFKSKHEVHELEFNKNNVNRNEGFRKGHISIQCGCSRIIPSCQKALVKGMYPSTTVISRYGKTNQQRRRRKVAIATYKVWRKTTLHTSEPGNWRVQRSLTQSCFASSCLKTIKPKKNQPQNTVNKEPVFVSCNPTGSHPVSLHDLRFTTGPTRRETNNHPHARSPSIWTCHLTKCERCSGGRREPQLPGRTHTDTGKTC